MPGFLYDAEPQELVPICKLHEKPASYTAVNISKLHIIVRCTDIKKRPGKGPFLSRDVRYAFLFVRNHIRAQDVLQKRIRTFDYLADPIPARRVEMDAADNSYRGAAALGERLCEFVADHVVPVVRQEQAVYFELPVFKTGRAHAAYMLPASSSDLHEQIVPGARHRRGDR